MKTSNKLLLIFLGTIVFLLIASLVYMRFFGLDYGERIVGSGITTTETRQVSSYSSVEFNGPFDVTIIQSNEPNLTLSGDEKILPYIITEKMDDGTLRIGIKKGYSLGRHSGIDVRISMPEWNKITLSGSGQLVSQDTLSGDYLDLQSNGSGEMDLTLKYQSITGELNGSPELSLAGVSQSLAITSNGSGDIHAMDLICQSVTFNASGSTDAEFHADSTLHVTVNGSGDVTYTGNATDVRSNMNGSGQLSRK